MAEEIAKISKSFGQDCRSILDANQQHEHYTACVCVMFTLSVVTPTHNRAHTLPRAWESMRQNRTSNSREPLSFEWIVIDDGSTDNTGELVAEWQDCSQFPISYERTEHRGRNAAVNSAKELVSGELVTVLDSDDCFLDGAFDVIRDKVVLYDLLSDNGLGGLGFLCEDELGNLLLAKSLDQPIRCSYLASRFVHKLRGEITYIEKKNYFRLVNYVELPPPLHVAESCAHAPLSKSYEFIYVDHVAVCRHRHDGLPRMTQKWPRPPSRQGHYLRSQASLLHMLEYFSYEPRFFWKRAIDMSRSGLVCGISLRSQCASLNSAGARLLWLLALPVGILKRVLGPIFRRART